MARSHTLASFRPAGFALLRPASKPQLDTARIITLSGTIAVNTLAFGLLLMPLSLPAPLPLVDEKPELVIDWLPKKPVEATVMPPQPPAPPVARPAEPPTVAPTHSEVAATSVVVDTGTDQATDTVMTEDTGPAMDLTPAATGPSPVQLEYLSAPAPAYPRMAKQRGITGTVLLQVLVGIDGRPLDVTVAKSSGNRELDEAARAQVLRRWSFQPAQKDGQVVQAIGMVPIEFALR